MIRPRAEKKLEGFLPICVVRTGGMPFDELQSLAAPDSVCTADTLTRSYRELVAQAVDLSAVLYDLVPRATARKRRRLLRLRRDVHNIRLPRDGDITVVPSPQVRRQLESFADAVADLNQQRGDFAAIYGREIAANRTSLRAYLGNADFAAGLRLSSSALAGALARALSTPNASLDAKTERGLLRYLTRMAAKATPFGRFCAIVPGVLTQAPEPVRMAAEPTQKWSRIRANKKLMKILLDQLLQEPAARRQLPLRINPTICKADGHISYLASFDTRESFQAVSRNAAVDTLVDRLRNGGARTVQAIATEILNDPEVDATQEEAEEYVDRFLEIGLLQLDLSSLGHDPDWPPRLRAMLEGIQNSRAAESVQEFLHGFVGRLKEVQRQGVSLDGPVDVLNAYVTSTLASWQCDERGLRGPVVYEDASSDGEVQFDTRHFGTALKKLRELLVALAPFGYERSEKSFMYRFFVARFGSRRVPLLDFYETYYREHVKPGEAAEKQPPGTTESRADPFQHAAQRLAETIARRWAADPSAKAINITRADIEEVGKSVPNLPDDPRSVSAFVTWVPRREHPEGGQIVLPRASTSMGFGKYFSRFLYILPDEVLATLRDGEAHGKNVTLAEIAGDQAFNGNLRPPIHQCEIVYPTGDRVGCPEAVEVVDLEVVASQDRGSLDVFRRGSHQRVAPLDLGFLNPRMRPPLYRLLRHLSPVTATYMNLPGGIPAPQDDTEDPAQTPGCTRRPRITYEKLLVVARETWAVPMDTVPMQESGEGDADYFIRVRNWRADLGLPEQVYLKAARVSAPHTERSEEAEDAEADVGDGGDFGAAVMDHKRVDQEHDETSLKQPNGTVTADLRKPQYIDFRSPLLVGLLRRYRELNADFVAVMEECLPRPDQLPRTQTGHRYVTEAILQIDLGTPMSPTNEREIQVSPPECAAHA